MKNTSKLAFAVIISLITISCNQNPPGNTGRDNIKITPMEVIKNQAFGDVILRVNKLDTKLIGFKTKAKCSISHLIKDIIAYTHLCWKKVSTTFIGFFAQGHKSTLSLKFELDLSRI